MIIIPKGVFRTQEINLATALLCAGFELEKPPYRVLSEETSVVVFDFKKTPELEKFYKDWYDQTETVAGLMSVFAKARKLLLDECKSSGDLKEYALIKKGKSVAFFDMALPDDEVKNILNRM